MAAFNGAVPDVNDDGDVRERRTNVAQQDKCFEWAEATQCRVRVRTSQQQQQLLIRRDNTGQRRLVYVQVSVMNDARYMTLYKFLVEMTYGTCAAVCTDTHRVEDITNFAKKLLVAPCVSVYMHDDSSDRSL